jgi:hypothetical protein
MSDHIALVKGNSPWRPSDTSELVEVFHSFDVPLIGIVRQDAVSYLFWCVVGHAGPDNAWAYARMDDSFDSEYLRSCTNEEFDDRLKEVIDTRVCTFAVASDDAGITEWVIIDPPADQETTFEKGMAALQSKITEVIREFERLQEQYSSIRAASTFAIEPSL